MVLNIFLRDPKKIHGNFFNAYSYIYVLTRIMLINLTICSRYFRFPRSRFPPFPRDLLAKWHHMHFPLVSEKWPIKRVNKYSPNNEQLLHNHWVLSTRWWNVNCWRDKESAIRNKRKGKGGVRIAIKVQPLLHTKFKSLSSEFYVPVCNCADCLT